jgi:tetratricopeptide (TPR) repeat protein
MEARSTERRAPRSGLACGYVAGSVSLALLGVPLLALAWTHRPPATLPDRANRVIPVRTPFAAALQEAVSDQWRAQHHVNEEREALEAWDPEAAPKNDQESWRRNLMACESTGSLRQAREAAQRAAARARTPAEAYSAALQRARIECDAGDHEAEFLLARRLIGLQPDNRLSWMVMRRAARCTGRSSLEEMAMNWLRAAADPAASAPSSGDADWRTDNAR